MLKKSQWDAAIEEQKILQRYARFEIFLPLEGDRGQKLLQTWIRRQSLFGHRQIFSKDRCLHTITNIGCPHSQPLDDDTINAAIASNSLSTGHDNAFSTKSAAKHDEVLSINRRRLPRRSYRRTRRRHTDLLWT